MTTFKPGDHVSYKSQVATYDRLRANVRRKVCGRVLRVKGQSAYVQAPRGVYLVAVKDLRKENS